MREEVGAREREARCDDQVREIGDREHTAREHRQQHGLYREHHRIETDAAGGADVERGQQHDRGIEVQQGDDRGREDPTRAYHPAAARRASRELLEDPDVVEHDCEGHRDCDEREWSPEWSQRDARFVHGHVAGEQRDRRGPRRNHPRRQSPRARGRARDTDDQ